MKIQSKKEQWLNNQRESQRDEEQGQEEEEKINRTSQMAGTNAKAQLV
ncbi:hypothetical protein [Chromobacterium haemolyticum]|nr:hypothetical protein [Chromobacterium haemolyticum]